MRVVKKMLLFSAVVATALGATMLRLHWAASAPSRPNGMPENAIWVPAPLSPLDLSRRGVWLGCRLDRSKNVNRCKLTDYAGSTELDEDFLPVTGAAAVGADRLHLKKVGTMELWTWSERDHRSVPIVHLEDGTILVPSRNLTELRARYAP
jgi:hypothetical protein